MTKFIISPLANQDLEEIEEYIARDDVDAAGRLLAQFDRLFTMLSADPGLGSVKLELFDRSVRFMGLSRYLVAYRWEQRPIEIARVVHQARNLRGLIR